MSHHRILATTLSACLLSSVLLVQRRVSLRPRRRDQHRLSAADLHSRDGAGRALAGLRRSLAPYADVNRTFADGFVPVSECTESPGRWHGGALPEPGARDGADRPRPSPRSSSTCRPPTAATGLLGAEWFQADADQDLTTDGDRPSLWGRPFNGPMLGHEARDAHPLRPARLAVPQANPDGVFAPWNPSVHC